MKTSIVIPIAGAGLSLLGLGILGFKAVSVARETRLESEAREASEQIQTMRMQANSEALNELNSELKQHEEALKALHESRRQES